MNKILKELRALSYVSSVRVVGSYARGKKRPKDIDIIIKLKITDKMLWKARRKIKSDIRGIIRENAPSLPVDVFLVTSDGKRWRLRPWVDISTKKESHEWE